MTTREPPHTVLGESIRAFAQALHDVSRRLAAIDDRSDAAELRNAWELLSSAREELTGDQRLLEELLEQERLRYGDLFDAAPDAYIVTDEAGTIIEVNRAAERLVGRNRRALTGKPFATLLDQDDRRSFRLMLARLPQFEVLSDWELAVRSADGSVLPVAATVSPTRDRNGHVTSLRWLLRDISERKRAEEQVISANLELERRVRERTAELEEAKREADLALTRLQAVVGQLPAGVIVADPASREVVTANDEAVRLLREISGGGDSAAEAWLREGLHVDGRPYRPENRPIERALRGDSVPSEHIEFVARDGSRRILEVGAAPVRDAHGKIIAAVATMRDVTERERRTRAEREFLTNAAHELRTPLAALVSAIEVLQTGAKENPADRDRFLRHAAEQCARLQRLVRSLLLLARAQIVAEQTPTEVVDVRELLAAAAEAAGDARVEVAPAADRVGVHVNRELAEQALLNLISNAAKYSTEGAIELATRQEDGFVLLEVSDRGRGMSAEERRRAFERFYRGGADASVPEGFGLGLSIAAQVAETLGGSLEIEPRSDGTPGTTARLRLPAA